GSLELNVSPLSLSDQPVPTACPAPAPFAVQATVCDDPSEKNAVTSMPTISSPKVEKPVKPVVVKVVPGSEMTVIDAAWALDATRPTILTTATAAIFVSRRIDASRPELSAEPQQ